MKESERIALEMELAITESFLEDRAHQIFFLSQVGCPGCDFVKEDFSEQIESGEITVLMIEEPDGKEMMGMVKADVFPRAIVVCEEEGSMKIYGLEFVQTDEDNFLVIESPNPIWESQE